jgi:hypothetical protein
MDILKVIEELRAYRAQIEEAIAALENLARRRGKRRGRPPKWLSTGTQATTRVMSEATRKKMAAAQRKRWAAHRKVQKSS